MADIIGTPADETLNGTSDADFIFGADGNDILNGLDGDDSLSGGNQNDTLNGGAGLDNLNGGSGDDVLNGGDDNDLLIGFSGNDTLNGDGGNDVLRSGAGIDTFDGGSGQDRVSFFDYFATTGAYVDLEAQMIFNDGHGNTEFLTSIEDLGLGTLFADTFYGSSGSNFIWAGLNDSVYGQGGDDSFFVDEAAAILDGGDGIDTITDLTQQRAVDGGGFLTTEVTDLGYEVNLTAGFLFDPWGGGGSVANIENVNGSEGDDIIIGDGVDNVLNGAGGDDIVRGEAGDDALDGGAGDDQLRGSAGTDSFAGGDGFDRISFFHVDATQGVTADLRDGTIANDGYGNAETFTGIEALGGHTRFADTFFGNDVDNLFLVGGGDTVYGFGGNDEFQVDDAPLLIDGGDGIDTILQFTQSQLVDVDGDGVAAFEFTTNGVEVNLNTGQIVDDGFGGSGSILNVENVGGSAGDDIITGSALENDLRGLDGGDRLKGLGGDDTLSGGNGDDRLDGGSNSDVLDGGEGKDTLLGGGGADTILDGSGNDTITGGAGKDTYFWSGLGKDRVTDFTDGQEKIFLSGIAGVDDFTDLVITTTADGWVRISYGDGTNTLILTGVTSGQITSSDFIFGGG